MCESNTCVAPQAVRIGEASCLASIAHLRTIYGMIYRTMVRMIHGTMVRMIYMNGTTLVSFRLN